MDQVRNFAQTNRSSLVNIIYIVAAVVLVYYLVMYYFNSDELKDVQVITNKLETTKSATAGGAQQKAVQVVKAGKSSKGRAVSEYTISTWIYVNSYSSTDNTKYQGILAFFDDPSTATGTLESVLYMALHPNQPKMIIRPGKLYGSTAVDPMVQYSVSGPSASKSYTYNGDTSTGLSTSITDSLTPCDVMDIDLQRWMCITVSVNGRIMDVYLDGKLARSCIMPNVQKLSDEGAQVIVLCPSSTHFNGYISGVMYSNYAVTPDVIYGRYQSGPYFSSSFLDYLVDKLGIRISYTGTDAGTTGNWSLAGALGLKTA